MPRVDPYFQVLTTLHLREAQPVEVVRRMPPSLRRGTEAARYVPRKRDGQRDLQLPDVLEKGHRGVGELISTHTWTQEVLYGIGPDEYKPRRFVNRPGALEVPGGKESALSQRRIRCTPYIHADLHFLAR